MTNQCKYKLDVVIVGGGIAGLFTLAKLINQGYKAVLIERNALGSGQTLKSQGIIHGGTKYALLGKMTDAQKVIASMPSYWRSCLAGQGDVDLSACHVLTDKQCMWAMPQLSTRITGFFASKMMKSRVDVITDHKPIALEHSACRGEIYSLDEPVIDTQSLISAIAHQYQEYILTDCSIDINDNVVIAQNNENTWSFDAEKIFITAGEGNAHYAKQQLRPLRMVYVRVPKKFGQLYVHVLEVSDKPRLTVSTHPSETDDEYIWYIGGNVAEKGASLSAQQTIALAKKELSTIFSWLDFSKLDFGSFVVNRAEGLADGKRPDTPTIENEGNIAIAWSTKLALAPMLAESLLATLDAPLIDTGEQPLYGFPDARIADYSWLKK